MTEEISNLTAGFEQYDKVLHDEVAIVNTWNDWERKGHNPFAFVDFITTEDGMFRVSIEAYDLRTLYVTSKYSTREHALRALGRILDQGLAQ